MYTSRSSVNPTDIAHLRSRSRSGTPVDSAPSSPSSESFTIPHSPLLDSATASSAAEETSSAAFHPPKPLNFARAPSSQALHAVTPGRPAFEDDFSPPERPSRPYLTPKSNRLNTRYPNILRRRRKWMIAFFSTLVLISIIRRLFGSTIVLLRFKVVDYAYSEVWGFPFAQRSCGFRKEPLLFVKGDKTLSIVWEIGKCHLDKEAWSLQWKKLDETEQTNWRMVTNLTRSDLELDYDGGPLRSVYSTSLRGLEGGEMYSYQILKAQKPVRSYSFPFVGSHLASATRNSPPQSLHIACLADNQFNLRTFHSVLARVVSHSRILSSRSTPTNFPKRRPQLILHAGDQVQNPHDLSQWQTDFWDPMTKQLSYNLGSQVPLVLARGNHDWDNMGRNVYVGGSPDRRDWEKMLQRDAGGAELVKGFAKGNRGTYYSLSPHERVRIVVLDSNLVSEAEQELQEQWLKWEVSRDEWKRASIRICVVHTPPWIEWWNRRAWTDGHEWKWSIFVRQRLAPILISAECSLLLSGHSHSYSRGFLPASLATSFTSLAQSLDSKTLPPFAVASIKVRSWEKRPPARSTGVVDEPGIVTVVFGGAGGTLDLEKVEEWGLFERGIRSLLGTERSVTARVSSLAASRRTPQQSV